MSDIQRTVIRDEGERVLVRNNHALGLVFAGFAAIPMLVPFKANASYVGTWLTSAGAVAFLVVGLGLFLWRRSLELDFLRRTSTLRSGFWPSVRCDSAPLAGVSDVSLVERRAFACGTTYVLAFTLPNGASFTFFETPERDEALEERAKWLARLRQDATVRAVAA
jgi:Na+/proline symporter